MCLRVEILDSAEGREKAVNRLRNEIQECKDLTKMRDIGKLKVLAARYPEIAIDAAKSKV
jgi:hypothetical protein